MRFGKEPIAGRKIVSLHAFQLIQVNRTAATRHSRLRKSTELWIARPVYESGMASYTFLYRCPTTGHKVQGIVRDTPAAPNDTAT